MLVVRYEGPRGGPLVTLRDGDVIEMDIANRVLTVRLGEDEPQARLDEWVPPRKEIPQGFLRLYAACVGPASRGAVLEG